MDLIHTENIKFIGGKEEKQSADLFSQLLNPAFASGNIFSQSLLNSLIAATYYNVYSTSYLLITISSPFC